MRIFYSLYDRLLDRRALALAFEKVRRASGAPGVDGQTISDFQSCLLEELNRLVIELRSKTYQPQPVRRVTIPKPGGGERHLGIRPRTYGSVRGLSRVSLPRLTLLAGLNLDQSI